MTFLDFVAICADAVVMTLLLRAGAAKLVAPAAAAAAVGDVLPARRPFSPRSIRTLAVLELVTVVGLAIPRLEVLAHFSVIGLGVAFSVAGLLGLVRHSELPCGCFGSGNSQPLGAVNVFAGLYFLGAGAAGLALRDDPVNTAPTTLVAVILSITWLIVANRRSGHVIIRNLLARSEVGS